MGEDTPRKEAGSQNRALERLQGIAQSVRHEFTRERRVLSFHEYLTLFEREPRRHSRDAALYLLDMIRFYGEERVEGPTGPQIRYRVFDQSFLSPREAQEHGLVGQELVQQALVHGVENFVRQGRSNRVLLLHGPNGSAKSTIAACLMRGLEDYSQKEEGATYRFHWVFPKKSSLRGSIGFSGDSQTEAEKGLSYAHLPDEQLETKLVVEVRDHPLFLILVQERRKLLSELLGADCRVPHWLTHGSLCHKNQQIYNALLTSYDGSLTEVLRHVQVERTFLSKRYRIGAVTLGPEISVDAQERQVTADRNLGALPTSLQGLSLYDVTGELVDAGGGILELSDLLKRPIDAYKYLQITAETGEVSLSSQSLQVNCVFLASANELHLSALREHPEFESFRGRFDLIAAPYLRDIEKEQQIYDRQMGQSGKGEVAPHATEVAARFAVLTRLLKPEKQHYDEEFQDAVGEMTAWTKMLAYSGKLTRLRVKGKDVPFKRLVQEMAEEKRGAGQGYEGSFGASPRMIRGLLLDAAQDAEFRYLSPFSVLTQLDRFCERVQDFSFLRREVSEGGFQDHQAFRSRLRDWLLDEVEDELRVASGLVDEERYEALFLRYVTQVSASVKGETLENPHTGQEEAPDETLMTEVEALLGLRAGDADARSALMSRIAAWAIDHPGQKLTKSAVFLEQLDKIRSAVFEERRQALGKFAKEFIEATTASMKQEQPLTPEVRAAQSAMIARFGYSELSAHDAIARLYSARFAEKSGRSSHS